MSAESPSPSYSALSSHMQVIQMVIEGKLPLPAKESIFERPYVLRTNFVRLSYCFHTKSAGRSGRAIDSTRSTFSVPASPVRCPFLGGSEPIHGVS